MNIVTRSLRKRSGTFRTRDNSYLCCETTEDILPAAMGWKEATLSVSDRPLSRKSVKVTPMNLFCPQVIIHGKRVRERLGKKGYRPESPVDTFDMFNRLLTSFCKKVGKDEVYVTLEERKPTK